MKTKVVIYHGGCSDGFCSAYLFWKAFGDDATYYPGVYSQDPPDLTDKEVYIVDFSYKRPVMEQIAAVCKSLTWLDHHVSAIKDMEGFDGQGKCELITAIEKSGAGLAYQYLKNQLPEAERPRLMVLSNFIEDQDLWRFRLEGTKEFSIAERSHPQTFEAWDKFDVPTLLQEGRTIKRYYDQKASEIAALAYEKEVFGHKVMVVNCPMMFASDVGHLLDKDRPFSMMWYFDGISKQFVFSLRSDDNGVDVSEIAKRAGGGGHAHAAGFKCTVDQVDELLELV